jgi:hypothetical protein
VLLLGAVAAGAIIIAGEIGKDRIDKLLSGVDAEREQEMRMLSKYRVGEDYDYDVTQEVSVMAEGVPAAGTEVTIGLKLGMGLRIEVLEVDSEGNGSLRFVVHDMDADVSMDLDGQEMGGSMPLSSVLPDEVAFRLRMDPFGKPLGEAAYEDGCDGLFAGGDVQNLFLHGAESVPRHRLRVGDTWSSSERIPLGGGAMGPLLQDGVLTAKMTYRMEGYKMMAGRDCMVISAKGQFGASDLRGVSGGLTNLTLDGKVKGAVFFDPGDGVLVNQSMDFHMEMTASTVMGPVEVAADGSLDVVLKE